MFGLDLLLGLLLQACRIPSRHSAYILPCLPDQSVRLTDAAFLLVRDGIAFDADGRFLVLEVLLQRAGVEADEHAG